MIRSAACPPATLTHGSKAASNGQTASEIQEMPSNMCSLAELGVEGEHTTLRDGLVEKLKLRKLISHAYSSGFFERYVMEESCKNANLSPERRRFKQDEATSESSQRTVPQTASHSSRGDDGFLMPTAGRCLPCPPPHLIRCQCCQLQAPKAPTVPSEPHLGPENPGIRVQDLYYFIRKNTINQRKLFCYFGSTEEIGHRKMRLTEEGWMKPWW
ncbi:PREDICTED: uncharacterized protein LOC108517765 [Rhinopithecus bieti]|uniref:uncharacterized protein LOC108517765 n=1 Tax=Rhinopithecus bieti TaxID=61621 RepID=UPI00083BA992|nr:PREDICTED: uncharacterized protein LOC108517765 [Rhinopithecus bieti]